MKVKKGYKKTELEMIPEEWQVVQLENILTIKYGKSQKNVEDSNGKYPILGTGGLMGYANSYLYDKTSVLIGRKGTIDKPQYINKPFWTVDTLFYTDIKINSYPKWVYYIFLTIPWKKYNEASGVPSLSVQNIHQIKIPLPPLPEQKKIANILSTVDEKIALIDNQIDETETLKKGLMQKLLTEGIGHGEFKDSEVGRIPVGWGVKQFTEMATIKHGYAFKSSFFSTIETDNVVLTPGNVKIGGGFNKKFFRFYDDTVFPEEYILSENDLIISMTDLTPNSDTLGFPFLVPKIDKKHLLHNQRLGKVEINTQKVNKLFLFYYLCSNLYRNNIVSGATGTTVKHTSPSRILSEFIPFPPLKEQTQIAQILSTTDEKIEILRDKKEAFQKLKKGLMQKLLTGEIRVIV